MTDPKPGLTKTFSAVVQQNDPVPLELEVYFDKVEELSHRMIQKFSYSLQDLFSHQLEEYLKKHP